MLKLKSIITIKYTIEYTIAIKQYITLITLTDYLKLIKLTVVEIINSLITNKLVIKSILLKLIITIN